MAVGGNTSHFTSLTVRPKDGGTTYFSVSETGAVSFAGALAINTNKLTVDTSGNTAMAGTLGVAGAFTLNSVATQTGSVTTGTIRTKLLIAPTASATITNIDYHKLVAIGDVTGNTAYGMGDPAKPTTGLMACFGRTALATGTFTDTAADFRIINKLVDTTGAHSMQGLYVKAKNYADATLTGNLYGAFIECVPDGTVSGDTAVLKLGSDGKDVKYLIDATAVEMTEYTSGKVVILAKFTDAAGTVQYLIHNTDSATAVSVTSSAPS